jgi:hypothetical protein
MPVVFVHGVGTRKDGAYEKAVQCRVSLMRRFLLPPLGLDVDAVRFWNPYWGGDAAKFAWDFASLPSGRQEKFGPGVAVPDLLLAEVCDGEVPRTGQVLVNVARKSMADAIDLLWATAFEMASETEASSLAELAVCATELARDDRDQPWLGDVDNDTEFVNQLAKELSRAIPAGGEESFGPKQAFLRLREGLGRINATAGRLAGAAAVEVVRPSLNRSASVFLGDIFVYLQERETSGKEAPIAKKVTDEWEQAAGACNDRDPKLVVIAHSMGGNIVYDLLSGLRKDLACDVLVTVGSQVGVFAELGLFESVTPPANPVSDRVPPLGNVGRWINVFDPNDILGFATGKIFSGVSDYRYSTGKGVLAAHSTYFIRPSFYDRLATRLGADE